MKTKLNALPLFLIGTILFFFVSISNVLAQSKHFVDVTNNVFTPKELTVQVGDTVVWVNKEGFHNVNATTATYPSNPESFGNSTSQGWTFSHIFLTSGTYDYQCDPHVSVGMVGKVVVETTTQIEDITAQIQPFFVYPNPANDKIYLSGNFTDVKNLTFQLYNLAGILKYKTTVSNANSVVEIDVSDLQSGSYFIQIENTTTTNVARFIKK